MAIPLLVLLLVSCGTELPQKATTESAGEVARAPQPALPSTVEAQALVANSAEFSEYQFTNAAYSLPMQESMMTTPAREVAAKLSKADGSASTATGASCSRRRRRVTNDFSFVRTGSSTSSRWRGRS